MTRLRDGHAKAPASRGGPEPIGRLALTLKLPPHVSPSGRESASSWRLNPMRSHLRHCLYVWNKKGTQAPLAKKSAYEAGRRLHNKFRSLLTLYLRETDATHSSRDRARLLQSPHVFHGVHGQPATGEHALMYACRKLAVDPLHVARIGDGGPAQNGDCHGADRPADGGKKPAPCNRNQPWSAPRVTREPTTYYTHNRLTVCSCHAISTDWDMFRKRTGRCLAILPATTSNGGIKTHCGSTSSAASLRRQVCRASRGFCYFSALTGSDRASFRSAYFPCTNQK